MPSPGPTTDPCPSCSQPVPAANTFCGTCGTRITPSTAAVVDDSIVSTPPTSAPPPLPPSALSVPPPVPPQPPTGQPKSEQGQYPPGWYDFGNGSQGYWDGTRWVQMVTAPHIPTTPSTSVIPPNLSTTASQIADGVKTGWTQAKQNLTETMKSTRDRHFTDDGQRHSEPVVSRIVTPTTPPPSSPGDNTPTRSSAVPVWAWAAGAGLLLLIGVMVLASLGMSKTTNDGFDSQGDSQTSNDTAQAISPYADTRLVIPARCANQWNNTGIQTTDNSGAFLSVQQIADGLYRHFSGPNHGPGKENPIVVVDQYEQSGALQLVSCVGPLEDELRDAVEWRHAVETSKLNGGA